RGGVGGGRGAGAEPPETVATVGTIAVSPGALSVIPARVRLGLDARGIDSVSLQRLPPPRTPPRAPARRAAGGQRGAGPPAAGRRTGPARRRAGPRRAGARPPARDRGDGDLVGRGTRCPASERPDAGTAAVRAVAGRREPHAVRGC